MLRLIPSEPSPTPNTSSILSVTDTKKAADPPPHRLASVSTMGFASHRASFETPRQSDSRTGFATAMFMTRVHSSRSKKRMRFGGWPLELRCHQASAKTPINRTSGIRQRVNCDPTLEARYAPAPLACRAKMATELAMLMLAKNAVSDSVELEGVQNNPP